MNTVVYKCYRCDSETGCEHMTPMATPTAAEVAAYKADRRYLRVNYAAASAYWAERDQRNKQRRDLENHQHARYSKARQKQLDKLDAQDLAQDRAMGDLSRAVNDACHRVQDFKQRFWGTWLPFTGERSRHHYVQNWYRSYGRTARVIEPDGTVWDGDSYARRYKLR